MLVPVCALLATLMLVFPLVAQENRTIQHRWDTHQVWESGTSSHTRMYSEGIGLDDQILIESDAPGVGYDSDPAAIEIIRDGIVMKKTVFVERVPVRTASVVALLYPDSPPEPNNGRHILVTVNGSSFTYEVKHFWTDVKIPGQLIRKGENVITITVAEPDTRFRTWISLERNYPIGGVGATRGRGTSQRSTDGGRTWSKKGIGQTGKAMGEYVVRLKTESYCASGELTTSVFDIADPQHSLTIGPPATVHSFSINTDTISPKRTSIQFLYRTGNHPTVNEKHWTSWIPYSGPVSGNALKGRYAQIRVLLSSDIAGVTPFVRSLGLSAQVSVRSEISQRSYSIISERQYPLHRSSFPFAHEDPNHPAVKRLRASHRLDSVVNGSATEFEKMLRLQSWVSRQWNWHLLKPEQNIFEWDANRILTPDSSGSIDGGFCLHYAVVLMQVFQSFGYQARIVSADYSIWSGHEVCEVWSNDFGKWIMLDANFDTYFVHSSTGIPLNTLELHDLFVKEFYADSRIDRDDWSREKLVQMASEKARNLPVTGITGGGANGGNLKLYDWWNPIVNQTPYCGGYGPLTMGFIRLLPRSNYLSQPYPVPVNHGRTHWGWTGYINWYDNHTPRVPEHSLFTNRRNDLYWNINQVGFRATDIGNGMISFLLETDTPFLQSVEANVNGVVTAIMSDSIVVKSVPGINRVEFRTVNGSGVKGTVSHLEYMYIPAHQVSIPK